MEAQPAQTDASDARKRGQRPLDPATAEKVAQALDRAAQLLGGRKRMAELLSERTGEPIGYSAIGNWKVRGVPIEHCMPLEDLTAEAVAARRRGETKVTRAELRPHDYITHWPDLRPAEAN